MAVRFGSAKGTAISPEPVNKAFARPNELLYQSEPVYKAFPLCSIRFRMHE
jgi:hypothetical protein